MAMIRSLASHCGRDLRLLGGRVFRMHEHVGARRQGMLLLHHCRPYSVDQPADHNQNQHNGAERNNERSNNHVVPPSPLPFRFSFPNWVKWTLGSILTLVLPFWSNKWNSLLKLEDEVEMAADVVEAAAEVVEKVANVAEKVSSEMAERLPEDGKLKDAVLLVGRVSKEAAEEAHLTKDIIHKVDEVIEDVELLLRPGMGPEKLSDSDGGHQK